MAAIRKIKKVLKSRPTLEGAGVHLRRVFGNQHAPEFDPFLLLDDFSSHNPDHYLKGFPWHPHRGIETITYVMEGEVEHGDSIGNKGVISSGDVQWMTAGSGIVHQEMPKGTKDGVLRGCQLWANLPASRKMMNPRYRDVVSSQIPEVTLDNGIRIKIICGEVNKTKGPVQDVVIDPEYLDVTVPGRTDFAHDIPRGYTVFAYVFQGKACFQPECDLNEYPVQGSSYFDFQWEHLIGKDSLVLYEDKGTIHISTEDEGVRFLLISGKPINEPVAWYGPIVMNTQEELRIAFNEYQEGTFIKYKG
ncbi:MAG: pirin family protein [Spirochaetales bacterium]|nr:pirin family protein [Spirochaetales bacterium]